MRAESSGIPSVAGLVSFNAVVDTGGLEQRLWRDLGYLRAERRVLDTHAGMRLLLALVAGGRRFAFETAAPAPISEDLVRGVASSIDVLYDNLWRFDPEGWEPEVRVGEHWERLERARLSGGPAVGLHRSRLPEGVNFAKPAGSRPRPGRRCIVRSRCRSGVRG